MTNDELLSKTISWLRFPLIVGVVFIHFNFIADEEITIRGVEYTINSPQWLTYFITFCSSVLPRISVPLFFFMSGFLFFYRTEFNAESYKKKLKSRSRSLLIPYILWNTIFLLHTLSILVKQMLPSVFPRANKIITNATPENILYAFWDARHHPLTINPNKASELTNHIYPIDVPMWFIRDLMIVVILTPLIYWLIRKLKGYYPAIIGLIWYGTWGLELGHSDQLICTLFFFSWGAYYSIQKDDFVQQFRKITWILWLYPFIAIADTLCKEQVYSMYLHNTGIIVGIISSVILCSRLIEKCKIKVKEDLVIGSFMVYALHTLLLGYMKSFFGIIIPPNSPMNLLLMYLIVPTTTILICLGLYKILKKYLPSVASILTGGR